MRDQQWMTIDAERTIVRTPSRRPEFPRNAVVGVLDTATQVLPALGDLYAAGFAEGDVHVIAGAHAVVAMDPDGSRSGLDGRLTRMTQALFGMEMEHTERHVEEVNAGHYLLLIPSRDDATTERIGGILAAHGGHFVNYYSRWTARQLAA